MLYYYFVHYITPLGSLLYEKVLKKIKIRCDIDYEDAHEFLSDNSLSIYSGRIPPHITCHP